MHPISVATSAKPHRKLWILSGKLRPPGLLILSIAFIFLEYNSTRLNCVVVDELAHISAGVNHWERGFFSLYQENPPFVRCIVALPVWLSSPQTDYSHEQIMPGLRTEWLVGRDFARANRDRYFDLLLRARGASVLLGLACGCLIYAWARELFGRATATTVAALWLMDPSTLAHSGLATLDVGATFFGLLATYTFWHYLRRHTWVTAGLAGMMLGLALASKFSMLALVPSWLIMTVLDFVARRTSEPIPVPRLGRARTITAHFLLLGSTALVTLNCCYGFEGIFTRLGDYRFTSNLLGGGPRGVEIYVRADSRPSNVFAGSVLEHIPVPLPVPYLAGFDSQKLDEEIRLYRIRDGKLVRGGNLLGPLETLAIKLPPGTLLLMAALGLLLLRRLKSTGRTNILAMVIVAAPGLLFLGLLATQTGLNWAFRYTMPAIPYLLIVTGCVIRGAWNDNTCKLFVLFCLGWNAYEIAAVGPHYLSYANFFAGGTDLGHFQLIGSNYDWGQDLLRLKRWSNEHPDATPLVFACYNAIEPWEIGLGVTPLPIGPPGFGRRAGINQPFQPYYLAISTNVIHGLPVPVIQDEGTILSRRLACRDGWDVAKPFVRLTPSILIFYITDDKHDVYIDPNAMPPNFGATP